MVLPKILSTCAVDINDIKTGMVSPEIECKLTSKTKSLSFLGWNFLRK